MRARERGGSWKALGCAATLAVAQAAWAGPAPVPAAVADAAPRSARPANEFSLWGGGSVSPSTLIGKWESFDFQLAALRYGRRLWTNDHVSFDWTIDAIPVALLSLDRSGGGGDRDTVYGAGLAPLGFRLDYEDLGWFRPYLAASGGFLYFSERVPASAVKFNFTYDFGLGTQIFFTPDRAVTLGYAYHHISNGGIGSSNPGFDSNLLYAGFSIYH